MVGEKGSSAWVSNWMSCSGGDDFGEVVMEMMAVTGIAAMMNILTIDAGYLDVLNA